MLVRSPVYALPVELLTRVFVLGAGYDYPYATTPFLLKPDQDYYAVPSSQFQLVASHVCSHWRHIALRTASLWSILHFREPAHIPRAREFIARCLPSPHLFDILVDTVAERDHTPGVTLCRDELQQIFTLICPHVPRWRAFHLKVCDHECKATARLHLSTCGPAPNLETLQLYHFEDYLTSQNLYLATYRPPVMVFNNHLPRLKNVSLIGVNLPWAQSPYLAHLHTLELALHPETIRPPYEYWHNMLRSPHLHTLSLHYSGPRVPDGDTKLLWPDENERILVHSLENLSLTDLDPDYLVSLMRRLVLPRLNRLSLDLPEQDFTPFLDLITVPVHTPPCVPLPSFSKLDSLVLTALEASAESLRNFVRALRDLRSLEIHFATVTGAFLDILFDEMDLELPPSSPTRVPVLPFLQSLKMSGISGTKTTDLLHFRHTHSQRLSLISPVSTWIIKWSERCRGRDNLLDQLVDHGWSADDGTRVLLNTFEGDEDDVEEEGDEEEEVQAQQDTAESEDEDTSYDDDL